MEERFITDKLKKYFELLIEDYDASFFHASLLQGNVRLDDFKINCHTLNALNGEGAATGIDVDGLDINVHFTKHRQPFITARLNALTLDLSDEPVLIPKQAAREVAIAFGKDPDAPAGSEPKKPYDIGARVADSVELSIGTLTIRRLPPRSIMSDAQLKRHIDPQNLHRYVPATSAAPTPAGFVLAGLAPPLCVLTRGCGCLCCPVDAYGGGGGGASDEAEPLAAAATAAAATMQQPTGECPVDLSKWAKLPSPINVLVIELIDFSVANIDAVTHAPCAPEQAIVTIEDPPPTLRAAAAAAAAAAAEAGATPSDDIACVRGARRVRATLLLWKEDEDTGARLPFLAPLPITLALTTFKSRATGDVLDVHVDATFDDTVGVALAPRAPGAPVVRARVALGVAAAALASGLGPWFDGAESAIFAALAKEAVVPPPRELVPSAKQDVGVAPTSVVETRRPSAETTDKTCGMFA